MMVIEKQLSSAEAAKLPENEAKIAEFKKRAEADDARNEAAAKLFDPVALLQRAGQTHEVQHPTLGLIRYGEIEVSENKEAIIVLAGTVAGTATTFIASLPIPLDTKAPATALASTLTGAILLYWKSKVNKQYASLFFFVSN